MSSSEHELSYPYILQHPQPMEVAVPFEGDIESWLRRLEVYAPFDPDRIRDLERWRCASPAEHGEAFRSLLSTIDAMGQALHPKAPLRVHFPRPYRKPGVEPTPER